MTLQMKPSAIVQLIALKDNGVKYNVAVGFLKNNLTFHERDIAPECFNQLVPATNEGDFLPEATVV